MNGKIIFETSKSNIGIQFDLSEIDRHAMNNLEDYAEIIECDYSDFSSKVVQNFSNKYLIAARKVAKKNQIKLKDPSSVAYKN